MTQDDSEPELQGKLRPHSPHSASYATDPVAEGDQSTLSDPHTFRDGGAAKHATQSVDDYDPATENLENDRIDRSESLLSARFDDSTNRLIAGPTLDDSSADQSRSMDLISRVTHSLSRTPGANLATNGARALNTRSLRRAVRDWQMKGRSDVVDPFGLDPVYLERWRPIIEFLYRKYWKVETSGITHVPDRGPAVIVANHSGAIPYDAVMLIYALRYDHPAHRTARPLVEDSAFHLPFLGVALNRIGCVRAGQRNATDLLGRDLPIVAFPEGSKGPSKLYRQRYRLQRFGRGGYVKLALRSAAPIIPAAIVGAEEVHPMISRFSWGMKALGLPYVPITPTFPFLGPAGALPRRSRWHIRFGPPMNISADLQLSAADDQALVNQINERVRARIQNMLDDMLDRAATVTDA